MRRAALLCFFLFLAPVARADTGLLVGVDDDLAKWLRNPRAPLSVERALGLRAVRFSVAWQPGETSLDDPTRGELSRAIPAAYGMRVVLSVTGRGADAPQDDFARTHDELAALVRDLPEHTAPVPARKPPARRWIVSLMGNTTLRGRWRVGETMFVITSMGNAVRSAGGSASMAQNEYGSVTVSRASA